MSRSFNLGKIQHFVPLLLEQLCNPLFVVNSGVSRGQCNFHWIP